MIEPRPSNVLGFTLISLCITVYNLCTSNSQVAFYFYSMGVFSKIFGWQEREQRSSPENPAVSLSNPAAWGRDFWGGSKSGAVVNQKSVMGISAVWRAVGIISETLASLPLEVYKALPNGGSELAPNHPVHKLVNMEPSTLHTSFSWRQTAQAHLLLKGNHYAQIFRDGPNPEWFRILEPDKVKPIVVPGQYYEGLGMVQDSVFYKLDNQKDLIPSSDIIHIAGLGFDGVQGLSVLSYHRENLGMSISATDYGAAFFQNGAHLASVITVQGTLDDKAYIRMQKQLKKRAGAANAGGTEILEQGAKYEKLALSPQDAMFLETREFQVSEVARMFGLPPHLLADLRRATFSNIEQQAIEYVTYTIRPWAKRWEQELNRKLFKYSERGTYFVRFNLNALLRGDSAARARFYNAMIMSGVFTPDEVRVLENLNPKGGNADLLQIPRNIAFMDEPEEVQQTKEKA